MIKALSGTVFARGIAAILNLLIISLAGRNLGADAVGTISLVVLAITLIMLVNNLIGGGALTYLVARQSIKSLLLPAYAWAVFTCGIGFLLVHLFHIVPAPYENDVVFLAFMESIFTIHLGLLVGREKLPIYNLLSVLRVLVLFGVFAFLIYTRNDDHVEFYVRAAYVAFGLTLVASSLAILPLLRNDRHASKPAVWKQMLTQGGLIQLANIFQLLAYRFNYFLVERFMGLGHLGLFAVGTQLSEGSWMIPKSIGTVLYMKVSNEENEQLRVRTTIGMMHLAFFAAAAVLLVLMLIPESTYQWAFGAEIKAIPTVVTYLIPGILAMAGAQAFSHYFSGVGQNHQNTISSGIAMVLTVIFGYALVPTYGVIGAAITASIAYSALFIYQLFVFKRLAKCSWVTLLPSSSSVGLLRDLLLK